MKYLVTTLTIAGAIALAGCSKKAPEELPPPPVTDNTGSTPTPTPQGAVPGTQPHFVEVMAGRDTIYFDLDRYNIDSADQAALQEQARYLAQYPQARATIEGHCDERGTRDYNLALGERRANAAKNYLISLGVAAERLTTVSYGKERPIALGSNEESWSRNRRAVTIVMN